MSGGGGEGPRFGFGDLSDIAPGPINPEPDEVRRVDAAAERLGFTSRQAPVRRRKRQLIEEPTDQINIRAAIADINAFVEWCEQHRYSYREGVGELVKKIA